MVNEAFRCPLDVRDRAGWTPLHWTLRCECNGWTVGPVGCGEQTVQRTLNNLVPTTSAESCCCMIQLQQNEVKLTCWERNSFPEWFRSPSLCFSFSSKNGPLEEPQRPHFLQGLLQGPLHVWTYPQLLHVVARPLGPTFLDNPKMVCFFVFAVEVDSKKQKRHQVCF